MKLYSYDSSRTRILMVTAWFVMIFGCFELAAQTDRLRKEIYAIGLLTKTDFKYPLYSFEIGFKPIHSFSSGIGISFRIRKRFIFRSDLLREKKGAKKLFLESTNAIQGDYKRYYIQYDLHYITSRNMIGFGIGKKQRLLLFAGGYISLLTQGQSYVREEGDPEIRKVRNLLNDGYSRFDVGLGGGAVFRIIDRPRFSLSIEALIFRGVTKVTDMRFPGPGTYTTIPAGTTTADFFQEETLKPSSTFPRYEQQNFTLQGGITLGYRFN